MDSDCPVPDANGHQWPNYGYTKGTVMDARGVQMIVAVPIEKVRLELDGQDPIMFRWKNDWHS